MDNQQLEVIFNETFSGLTVFYRDTDLPDELTAQYRVGQILQERSFTDMSYKGGGLVKNFRFLIVSSFGKDISALNPNAAQYGHIILLADSWFKVLDIYRKGGKTQVTLLNIPPHAVDVFKKVRINVEEDIVAKARQNFDAKIMAPPVEVLQTPEWQLRTRLPIGMSEKGELY